MNEKDVRIGNLVEYDGRIFQIDTIAKQFTTLNTDEFGIGVVDWQNINPIPLTEEWLLKFGFSIISENLAGKRYGYVIEGVFNSDLNFVFWKATKEAGKFFRKNLQLKSVHQLQNLYFVLTGEELTIKNQ